MYELIYRNLETGALIKEYCFADYEEKRRLFLEDQENIEFLKKIYINRPLFSVEWAILFWKCLTHETWDITPCEEAKMQDSNPILRFFYTFGRPLLGVAAGFSH